MIRKILLKITGLILTTKIKNNYRLILFNLESQLQKSSLKVETYESLINGSQIFFTKNDITGQEHIFPILERGRAFRKGFRAAGYSIAKTYAIPSINFSEGDVIIDVGANLGSLKYYFDHHLQCKVKYFAIDPGKLENFCLAHNLEMDPESTVSNVAVGNYSGVQSFFYAPKSADSSLGEIDNSIETYDVKVETLENLIDQWNLKKSTVKLVKIDAEGYELEVLQGAGSALEQIDYIAVDLGFEKGVEQKSTAPEVIHFLLSKGFEIENVGLPDSLRFLFRRANLKAPSNKFVFTH